MAEGRTHGEGGGGIAELVTGLILIEPHLGDVSVNLVHQEGPVRLPEVGKYLRVKETPATSHQG